MYSTISVCIMNKPQHNSTQNLHVPLKYAFAFAQPIFLVTLALSVHPSVWDVHMQISQGHLTDLFLNVTF